MPLPRHNGIIRAASPVEIEAMDGTLMSEVL
jgi:hypothetical protein